MADTAIIGVGCAGGHIVNELVTAGRVEAEFVAINTDYQRLHACQASIKLPIGTHGSGAGIHKLGAQEAEEAAEGIAHLCARQASVLLVAGLGGGTGSGAGPVVARIAKAQACRVVAVVTRPFRFEGLFRRLNDACGLVGLADYVDRLVTVRFADLMPLLREKTTLREAFETGSKAVARAVERLPEIVTTPGPENSEVVDVMALAGSDEWGAQHERPVRRAPLAGR
jgi:cell division protein FtsZ